MICISSRKRKLPSWFVNNQASDKHCKSSNRKTTPQNAQSEVQEQDAVSENTYLNNNKDDTTEASILNNVDQRSLANIIQNMATQHAQMSNQIAAINFHVVNGTCHTTQQTGQCDFVCHDIIQHSEPTHVVPYKSSRDAELTATLSSLKESALSSQQRADTCLPHTAQAASNVHRRAGTSLPRQLNENTESCIRVGTSLSGNQQTQIGNSSRYSNQQLLSSYTCGAGTSHLVTTNHQAGIIGYIRKIQCAKASIDYSATVATAKLHHRLDEILQASLASSTGKSYLRCWNFRLIL